MRSSGTRCPAGVRTILDATCGIGTHAIGLALRGYEVTATDLSPASVERAGREAARFGTSITLGVADIRTISGSIAGPFDVAISFDNALPHLVDPADLRVALEQLLGLLRPAGCCS
jgi:glycine/sarcosine N-methyltransferase